MKLANFIDFYIGKFKRKYPAKRITLNADEKSRLDYYIKPNEVSFKKMRPANSVSLKNTPSAYYLDWYRLFSQMDDRLCAYQFGDITDHLDQPTFTKSRPISSYSNNVLLPLNTVRHLNFISDSISISNKKDKAVWRGAAYREERKRFLTQSTGINSCDVADTSEGFKKKNFMSVKDQLAYKFIFAIQGNDVATNLKWIMSSNSIPIMPKPNYETWFCEGRLIAGQHYIEIANDFSNIEEVIENYSSQKKLLEEINVEGKRYASMFSSFERQFSIGKMVIDHYFDLIKN